MAAPIHQFRIKPLRRPTLNRAKGLARGLLFAAAPGWTNGFTASTFQCDYDDFTMTRGQFNTTVPNASPWLGGNGTGGPGIDNGDGSFNSVPEWIVPAGTRYDITFGFSAMCLIRPDVLTTDGTLPFFKHRNQPYGATEPGWMFTGAAGNVYRFDMSDGVNAKNVNSVTTQDTQRGHLVGVRFTPQAGGGIFMEFFVNGVLENAVASALPSTMGNPATTPIKFLGLGTAGAGQPAFSGLVSMGAVWNRPLSNAEFMAVNADPFTLWRQADDSQDLGALADFIGNIHKWALKPRRPAPRRADGLWRNVLHASAPWVWGYEQDTRQGDYDDITGTRALWNANVQTDASAFLNENYGRSIQQGNPNTNSVPKWLLNGSTRYDVSGGGFSFAALVRPNVLTTLQAPAYKRRSIPYGVANGGWAFLPTTSGNNWRATISDGVTQLEAVSNRPQDTVNPQLLIAVYDNTGVLSLYVNGILEDQSPPAVLSAAGINDPTESLNMLGVSTPGNGEFPGSVGMGVLWNRPISAGEILRLYSDPFIMWKLLDEDIGQQLAFQTYFHVF